MSYDIPYDTPGVGEQVVVFSTQSYAALCGFATVDNDPPVACGTIEGFLVFLLRDAPEIHLGYPSDRRFSREVRDSSSSRSLCLA